MYMYTVYSILRGLTIFEVISTQNQKMSKTRFSLITNRDRSSHYTVSLTVQNVDFSVCISRDVLFRRNNLHKYVVKRLLFHLILHQFSYQSVCLSVRPSVCLL